MSTIVVGETPAVYGAAAAVGMGGRVVGACAEERVTRIRTGGADGEWPESALALLLDRLDGSDTAVDRRVLVGSPATDATRAGGRSNVLWIDPHLARACTAYLTSPFQAAAIVVCAPGSPGVSVWSGHGAAIRRVEWPWDGLGFADAYSRLAALAGFTPVAAEQRFEALARLDPQADAGWVSPLLRRDDGGLVIDPALASAVRDRNRGERPAHAPTVAAVASALQRRLGELLLDLLTDVRRVTGETRLCLGGSLFQRSSMATQVKLAGLFDEVFVSVDPGDGGLAVGAVLHELGTPPVEVTPFLGPAYSSEEIKAVLDNCKLQYSWESDERAVQIAVKAMIDGRLVGWFDGPMEWGPRTLGARSILASPFSPYVLENLNRFLKHREPWRGYALSGLEAAVGEHLDGPARAPFMECDYQPKDRATFRHVLPSDEATLRVQTVDGGAPARFRRLLEAFGEVGGLPFLVNTSFNGFHEPIVCSPRDAVRVFYGSGIDLLVMPPFVIQK